MIQLVIAASISAAACNAPPGAEAIWSNPQTRVLVIGEVHGTVEIPELAGSLLCAAGTPNKPAILAIEADPRDGQAQVDAYSRSAGTAEDRAKLLAAPMWKDRWARMSEAVLNLVETARQLGSPVVLFDQPTATGPTNEAREKAMAAAWLRASQRGRVVVLTATGHADHTAYDDFDPPVTSAIRNLPAGLAVSIAAFAFKGQSWRCPRDSTPATASSCGPQPLSGGADLGDRVIKMGGSYRTGFDGVFSTGKAFTASPPAALAGQVLPTKTAMVVSSKTAHPIVSSAPPPADHCAALKAESERLRKEIQADMASISSMSRDGMRKGMAASRAVGVASRIAGMVAPGIGAIIGGGISTAMSAAQRAQMQAVTDKAHSMVEKQTAMAQRISDVETEYSESCGPLPEPGSQPAG